VGSILFRRVLAESAARYAAAGWPVAAGAWWDGARYRCSATPYQVTGHHLSGQLTGHLDSAAGWSLDSAEVRSWWTVHPHTLILPTGLVADALDVAAGPGVAIRHQLRRAGVLVPAASLPGRRLLLFVAAGTPPADINPVPGADLIHHGAGSYVPAPPSALQHGRASWLRPPWVDNWALPAADTVLHAIAAAGHAAALAGGHHAAAGRQPVLT
jgi:hypothetical protein